MVDISHWAPGKASVVYWSTKYIHEECFKVFQKHFKIRLCLNFSRGGGGGGAVAGAVFDARGLKKITPRGLKNPQKEH